MRTAESPREAARNRLLRRVDWRFLLPDPFPARTMCFASGPLAEAVAAVSGELVTPGAEPLPTPCDLAVAVDPSRETLHQASAALRAGGWLYAEWRVRPGSTPGAVRRRLLAAGFEQVTCYAPRPDPAHHPPCVWVPLDSSPAVRHFIRRNTPPHRIWRGVGRGLRDALWLAHPATRIARPLCSLARKPEGGTPAEGAIAHALADTVRAQWQRWGLGGGSDDLGLLLLTGGKRSNNKVVALACAGALGTPQVAIKIARTPEAAAGLANEARVLEALEPRAPEQLGIPRLLWYERRGAAVRLAETAVVGTPVLAEGRHPTYPDLARQVSEWQVRPAGRPPAAPRADWFGRLVEPVIADFVTMYGAAADPGMLREALDTLESIGPLPLVCEQRDFAPWNLLCTAEGRLAVLDWESAEIRGLPALDLLYFFAYAGFVLDGAFASGRFEASYRATHDASTRTGAVARACLAAYAEAVGVSATAIRPLRLLCWMLHARSEYRRFTAEEDPGGPTVDALRRHLFFRLWQTEVRHGA